MTTIIDRYIFLFIIYCIHKIIYIYIHIKTHIEILTHPSHTDAYKQILAIKIEKGFLPPHKKVLDSH